MKREEELILSRLDRPFFLLSAAYAFLLALTLFILALCRIPLMYQSPGLIVAFVFLGLSGLYMIFSCFMVLLGEKTVVSPQGLTLSRPGQKPYVIMKEDLKKDRPIVFQNFAYRLSYTERGSQKEKNLALYSFFHPKLLGLYLALFRKQKEDPQTYAKRFSYFGSEEKEEEKAVSNWPFEIRAPHKEVVFYYLLSVLFLLLGILLCILRLGFSLIPLGFFLGFFTSSCFLFLLFFFLYKEAQSNALTYKDGVFLFANLRKSCSGQLKAEEASYIYLMPRLILKKKLMLIFLDKDYCEIRRAYLSQEALYNPHLVRVFQAYQIKFLGL